MGRFNSVVRDADHVERGAVAGLIMAGGILFVVGFLPQTLTDEERPVLLLAYGASSGVGVALLATGLWSWRHTSFPGRLALTGVFITIVGCALFFLQTVVMVVSVAQGGRIPDVFLFIGLAFLMFIAGPILMGLAPRGAAPEILIRAGSLQAGLGALVALFGGESPLHDVGLLMFGAGWVAFGLGSSRGRPSPAGPRELAS